MLFNYFEVVVLVRDFFLEDKPTAVVFAAEWEFKVEFVKVLVLVRTIRSLALIAVYGKIFMFFAKWSLVFILRTKRLSQVNDFLVAFVFFGIKLLSTFDIF